MAVDQAGIMALPENQGMADPQMSMQESYGAMREALQEARPDADMELQEALAEIKAEISEISDENLGELISAIQSLYDNPQTYTKEVAQLVAEGDLDADDLPAEYDEEFLSAMLMVLIDEQRSRETAGMPAGMAGMMPPPQQFARGGIAEAARMLATKGRRGDTMLAHITPREARMLRSRGGSGTINPQTGLPEFFFKKLFKAVKKTFKRVTGFIKKALKSPIGRILGTIALGMVLGPAVLSFAPSLGVATAAGTTALTATGSAVVGGLSSGIITAASGGKLKDVLKSAALGAFSAPGGPISNYVGKYTGQFISNPVVREAANASIIGTAGGVLSGESLKDSLKTGLTQGVISGGVALASGANTQQVKESAANGAADALDDAATQRAIKDFEGPSGVSGAGAQRAAVDALDDANIVGSSSRPLSDTTALRTVSYRNGAVKEALVDIKTGNVISEGLVAGPGASAGQGAPTYKATEPPTNIFAPKPSPNVAATPTGPSGAEGTFYGLRQPGAPTAPTVPVPQMPSSTGQLAGVDFPYTGASSAPGYQVPGAMDSLGNMGSGAKKFLTGDFGAGAKQFAQGAEDLFMPGPSSAQYKDMVDDVIKANPKFTPAQAVDYLEKTGAVPGIMRTYGPTAVAGIGALAAAGGFDQGDPPTSKLKDQLYGTPGLDLINANPNNYLIQGLQGLTYDQQGNITGSQRYSSPYTLNDVRVPSMYANGGIAALKQGGYPRRTGQISGPGTEKSDSIPAMLSDGEFVMTAKAVRGAGGGSRRDGAKRMYALMHQLERNAARG
jgi:hypothetical protein